MCKIRKNNPNIELQKIILKWANENITYIIARICKRWLTGTARRSKKIRVRRSKLAVEHVDGRGYRTRKKCVAPVTRYEGERVRRGQANNRGIPASRLETGLHLRGRFIRSVHYHPCQVVENKSSWFVSRFENVIIRGAVSSNTAGMKGGWERSN